MKSTIANTTKYQQETMFTVISFDKETGIRKIIAGNQSPLSALHIMSAQSKNDCVVLLFPVAMYSFVITGEVRNDFKNSRISYNEAFKHAIVSESWYK